MYLWITLEKTKWNLLISVSQVSTFNRTLHKKYILFVFMCVNFFLEKVIKYVCEKFFFMFLERFQNSVRNFEVCIFIERASFTIQKIENYLNSLCSIPGKGNHCQFFSMDQLFPLLDLEKRIITQSTRKTESSWKILQLNTRKTWSPFHRIDVFENFKKNNTFFSFSTFFPKKDVIQELFLGWK